MDVYNYLCFLTVKETVKLTVNRTGSGAWANFTTNLGKALPRALPVLDYTQPGTPSRVRFASVSLVPRSTPPLTEPPPAAALSG